MVPVYGLGVWVKNGLYGAGLLRARQLGRPVVSVGSLSAGGAGKTPVVMMLAELLGRHGVGVDVLSRGYGRESGGVEEVEAGGDARRFGDEPVEMAEAGRGWGVRVYVGVERFRAGELAEGSVVEAMSHDREMGHPAWSRVHVLDDGLQHRRLWRDLNVVLLTLEDAWDGLLPGGDLREPLSSLRRADVVVLRAEEAEELYKLVRARTPAKIWVVRRELVLRETRLGRPLVFCGIARPDGFLGMLKEAGVEAAGSVAFGDHHAYTVEDFERLVEAAEDAGADGFVTTSKDAVKIPGWARQRLEEVGPVEVAGLRVRLVDEAEAMRVLGPVVGVA